MTISDQPRPATGAHRPRHSRPGRSGDEGAAAVMSLRAGSLRHSRLRAWILGLTGMPGRVGPGARAGMIGLLAGAGAAWVPAAVAAGFADPGSIDREVAAFIGGAGAGAGNAPPVDRRLRLAACGSPLALAWRGDRHDTVLVQCPDAGGWHLFVPVHNAGAGSGVAAVARGEEVTVSITGDGFTVSQSGEALEGGAVGDWIRVNPVKDAKAATEAIRARIVRPGLVAVLLP